MKCGLQPTKNNVFFETKTTKRWCKSSQNSKVQWRFFKLPFYAEETCRAVRDVIGRRPCFGSEANQWTAAAKCEFMVRRMPHSCRIGVSGRVLPFYVFLTYCLLLQWRVNLVTYYDFVFGWGADPCKESRCKIANKVTLLVKFAALVWVEVLLALSLNRICAWISRRWLRHRCDLLDFTRRC